MLGKRALMGAGAALALLAAGGPAVGDMVGHGGAVRALAVSPDGRRVLSGSFDYTARLWDFVDQTPVSTLDAHFGPVNAVAFLPGGRRLVTAGDDGVAILWDAAGAQPVRRFDRGPDDYLPGTKMPLQRVPDGEQLGNLIDYLRDITRRPQVPGTRP